MSDDEHYSDNESDNEDIIIPSQKKPFFNPSINIKSFSTKINNNILEENVNDDDSEPDDADNEDEDEDIDDDLIDEQDGGNISEVDDALEDESDSESEKEDSDSDIELDENGEPIDNIKSSKVTKNIKIKKTAFILQDDDEDEDEYDDNYLQKFDNELIKNYVNEFHPECLNHNYDEISQLSIVTKNSNGIIIDPLHKTIPYLTKYEKARIIGQRSKQIENGAKPLVKVPENIVEAYIIAELELNEKKIPFIIRRPIPGGGCEYWKLKDLENISF